MNNIVGRFAPSPSGRMHLGNVFAALMSYASAKCRGGSWLLRMEDLDRQRCKPEYAQLLLDDLQWLGLHPDEGVGTGGNHGPYYQSRRDVFYDAVLASLQSRNLTYNCFCSRLDLTAASAPHASDGHLIYSGRCRSLNRQQINVLRQQRLPSVRLILPDADSVFVDGHYGRQCANLAADRGDMVLQRSDGNYAYLTAVVTDDALMGVTEVVRACDLIEASHEQIYLFKLIGHNPPSFCHFPLLVAPDGRRLCKRDKSLAMDCMREKASPQQIIGLVAALARLQDEPKPMDLHRFVDSFCWDIIPKHNIVVDTERFFGTL